MALSSPARRPCCRSRALAPLARPLLLVLLLPLVAAAASPPLVLADTAQWCSPRTTTTTNNTVVSLYLAATNDVHNRVDEVDPFDGGACPAAKKRRGACAGGFARLATFFKQARQRAADKCAGALVADAGDQTTGQAWDAVYRQSVTAGMMARVGYDVTTLGNHEFDFDLGSLASFASSLAAADPPVALLGACSVASFGGGGPASPSAAAAASLNATVRRHLVREVIVPGVRVSRFSGSGGNGSGNNGSAPRFEEEEEFVIVRPPARLKIGFIGYVVSSTARTQIGARNVSFVPDAEAAARCAEELRAAHADLDAVVALSHLGYAADVALAPRLAGLVDVVVGGHSHTFLASPGGGGGGGVPIWDLNATAAAGSGGAAAAAVIGPETCAAAGACDRPEGPYPTVVRNRGGRPLTIVQARFASIYASLLRLDFELPLSPSSPSPSPSPPPSPSPLGRRGGGKGASRGAATLAPAPASFARPSRLLSVSSATGGSPALLGGPASSSPVAQDGGMLRYIDARRGPVAALARARVGLALPPGGLALGDARRAESPLGSYLCGAMLIEAAEQAEAAEAAASNGTPAAAPPPPPPSPDACLIGAGTLRQGIPPGAVTRADVAAAHPYGNALALARVTAAALVEAAEHGLTGVASQSGRFPQVGGLRLYLDSSSGQGGNPAFVALYLLPPLPGQGAGGGYRAALAKEEEEEEEEEARRKTATRGGASAAALPPAADRARLGVRLRRGDNATTLVLASSDYLLSGGDGYGMLGGGGGEGGGGPPRLSSLFFSSSPRLSLADVLVERIRRDTASAAGGAREQDPLGPRIVDCAAARREGRCAPGGGGDVVFSPCCGVCS